MSAAAVLRAAALRTSLLLLAAAPCVAQAAPPQLTSARTAYLLSCGGCHGYDGQSNALLVPDLKDLVGYYLLIPEGRSYLVRLPNVAFSINSDRQLAALLNYVVFTLGRGSAPRGAKPYTAAEVARLRARPLIDVSLIAVRRRLVDTLIHKYDITRAMSRYGGSGYCDAGSPDP